VAIDRDELNMLRAMAREVFSGSATLASIAELELLSLLTPEISGGAGWRVLEASTVVREAGRALSPLPVSGSMIAAAALAGADEHRELLEALLGGKVSGAVGEHAGITRGGELRGGPSAVIVPAQDPLGALVITADGGAPVLLFTPDIAAVTPLAGDDRLDTTREELLVDLSAATPSLLQGGAEEAKRLRDVATLLACADTLGALEATVERVREYLIGREAFGRPLASFQVIQHRLTDLDVLVAAADSLVLRAATALATQAPYAHRVVRLMHEFLVERCVAALDDCVQLCGGMGFTWEWPVHHALRRAIRNAAIIGRRYLDAAELQESLDGPRPTVGTNETFRARVRSLIAEHAPFEAREGHRAPSSKEQEAAMRTWYRTMYESGLIGASWPQEWGGRPEHEPLDDLVVVEELIRARAPRPIDQVLLASHTLLHFGSPEQKREYLPRIRTGEHIWCQLFSEPGAGSDLAGVTARATLGEDGSWVLGGQKTWTTDGHWAQFGMALLRTDPTSQRQAGLTVFIVPMHAEGLEIRPIVTMGGAHEFNDVFLDGVVLGPEHVVGDVGQGWAVAMAGLESERYTVGGNVLILELLLADLVAVAAAVEVDGARLLDRREVLERISQLRSEAEAASAFITGRIERVLAGKEGEAEASIAKLLYSEAYVRIARYAMQVVTQHEPVPDQAQVAARRLKDAYLWSRNFTISGGSSEVMRNIIAKRRLRLPSGR
jgi:alkylation response protein AidB-like acyl-CoA dehydrogenase